MNQHSTMLARRATSRTAGPTRSLLGIGAAVVLGLVLAATLLGSSTGEATDGGMTAARRFLATYVKPSGQVVRLDQGGDTVSEGQAYGLLLAQLSNRAALFDRIWNWTTTHLQRPDGQLAYLARPNGQVKDSTPAADADLLTAWVLSRASGPHAAAYHAQARRMSATILAHDTIARPGMLLLAAGPWATGSPGSLDPSYWAPQAFTGLARFTGDRRWTELQASSRRAMITLTHGGALLPPDWARLDGTVVSPTPAPDHQAPQVRYGLDAQRAVVWLASSCLPADRRLAARWWPLLSRGGRSGALALTSSGQVLDGQTNALPSVAAAAAAAAAGDTAARGQLLAAASRTQAEHPTYYGGAWLALGKLLLGGSALNDNCTANGGGG